MKLSTKLLALLPLLVIGCAPTRIVTVAPSVGYSHGYTTVTVPKAHTVTKTEVYAVDDDICLHLDLQAVAAAFAQSSTVQEFETLLNNSSYILSNLDLNCDGYVDYLRVLETIDGGAHVFLIQAVLAANVYQDVATLVAEVSSLTSYHVQVIGAPYIYGANYIIQPVFVTRPVIFTHLIKHAYAPWRSPWYWSHFPPYYKHPAPIHINHYQAYVDTYMRNHRYCHGFEYAAVCHFPRYEIVCKPLQRNDYGIQHPERSFATRNAGVRVSSASAGSNATPARVASNARDITELRKASSVTTVNSTSRSAARTSSGSSSTATPARTASSSSSASSSTATPSRTSSSSSTATPSRSTAATASSRSTSTAASSSSSSSSATTSRTSSSSSSSSATPSRTSSSSSSSSSSSATPSRSSSSTASTRTSSSSSSASSSSSSSQTTRSRVSTSGSSSTKISTTTASGSSSTVNRTSPSRSSSSSSSSTATRSGSAARR